MKFFFRSFDLAFIFVEMYKNFLPWDGSLTAAQGQGFLERRESAAADSLRICDEEKPLRRKDYKEALQGILRGQ